MRSVRAVVRFSIESVRFSELVEEKVRTVVFTAVVSVFTEEESDDVLVSSHVMLPRTLMLVQTPLQHTNCIACNTKQKHTTRHYTNSSCS